MICESEFMFLDDLKISKFYIDVAGDLVDKVLDTRLEGLGFNSHR